MSRKVVVTCAVTGGNNDAPHKSPAVPVTPDEIAKSALEAADAGAAILHIHVRDPKTKSGSMAFEYYEETVKKIRAKNKSVILNITTGPGARFIPGADDPMVPAPGSNLALPAKRVAHIEKLKPELCTLDVATLNFGPNVFINTPAHLAVMARKIKEAGVKPEIEVFDLGGIELAKKMIHDGLFDVPPLFQLCLGISWGAPSNTETMLHMRNALPAGANWSAFGIGRQQFQMVAATVLLGGNVRVGLEDNLYVEPGTMAKNNAVLVEKAVRIIKELGASIASPDDARSQFGVGRMA